MIKRKKQLELATVDDAEQGQLALLSAAERQLAQCTDWVEILDIRDEAEAVRVYLRARHMSHQAQNQAARLKLLAERKIGTALAALKLRGGDRKSNSPRESLILEELGVDRNASSRWQKEAAASGDVFEIYCEKMASGGGDISTRGFLKYLRNGAHRGPRKPTAPRRRSRKSVVDTQTSPPCANCGKSIQKRRELCEELENHLATLTKLVAGIVNRCGDRIEPVEQREIPRYLRQMADLLAELKGSP